MHRARQRGGELAVPHRRRRRRIHRARVRIVPDRRDDEADHVIAMDPAHPLLAVPESSAEAGTEGNQHLRQRAATGTEHDTEPERRDADVEIACTERLRLPAPADLGEEVVARRGILVQDLVAVRSVEADRGSIHEDPRSGRRSVDRLHDYPCSIDAAREDRGLAFRRPTSRRDRLAGEVHDHVGLDHRRADAVPRDRLRRDVPRMARHDRHVVPRRAQRARHRIADEARSSRQQHSHRGRPTTRAGTTQT